MDRRYWRFDRQASVENFRSMESYGMVWQIEHYFLSKNDLPDWQRNKPPLDLDELDYRFANKPKSKKIPEILMSAGQLYLLGALYDFHFKAMIGNFVTAMPLKIGDQTYYFLRPDVIIDCVDFDRSEWIQREDGFRYSWPKLALKDVPENAPPIFRPGVGREFWKLPVFSDLFVDTCKANMVVGAEFEEVYPLLDERQS